MEFVELMLQAFALSMDAFAVSVCKGLAMKKATLKHGVICGGWFGGFQALMPLIGYFLASLFARLIEGVAPYIAFILLAIIGINMLKEAFSGCDECENHNDDMGVKTMFVMAVATSIDAMAAGVSMGLQPDYNIWGAIALIGLFTFGFCVLGVKVGNVFGSRFEKKAQIAGGVILILLGVKIILEHFHLLPW